MMKKVDLIMKTLNERYFEREDEIAGSLLALLSGEHLLLIGPPGTAKSMLARDVCQCLDDRTLYYYLLTRFTSPEEVFGPLSITGLKNDEFKRKTEGYLPSANIAFLDEIFKANSSILNSLLTILNEKKYHNGRATIDVPLYSIYGASNELPDEEEELQALYDRFLFRYNVDQISDGENFIKVMNMQDREFVPPAKLSRSDLDKNRATAEKVIVDDEVLSTILSLRNDMRRDGRYVSDRRWKKSINIMKIAAASLGKKNVDITFLPILQHTLWDSPDDKEKIRTAIFNTATTKGINLSALRDESEELFKLILKSRNVVDANFRFPKVVYCYDCSGSFTNLDLLRKHSADNPKHSFMDPYEESKGKTKSYRKYNFNELVALLEKDHEWKLLERTSGPEEKLYRKELDDLRRRKESVLDNYDNDRNALEKYLGENIWISERDRKEMLLIFSRRLTLLTETEGIIRDAEKILE